MKQHFNKLTSDNTMFQLCCHNEVSNTMVNVQFKPGDMNTAKPHLGIGVLAFVVCQMTELVLLTKHGELMSSSSFTTTADNQKLKLGAPKLPVTIDESINMVKRCRDFHTRFLGEKCAYAIVCNQVFRVLCKKHTSYIKLGTSFGPAVGYKIFHQLNKLAVYFFGKVTSEAKYRNCQILTLD